MSYRFMRVLVFFDLPVLTAKERREYRRFRNELLKNGFIMLQYSVYCRMALNKTYADQAVAQIRKMKPSNGLVMTLMVTEKQFQNMEIITGEFSTDVINSDERLVII